MDYDMMYDDMYDDETLQDMMAQYGDYQYDDYPEYTRVTLKDMVTSCMGPTVTQTVQMLFPLYMLCLAFRLTLFLGGTDNKGQSNMPAWFPHLTSAVFGGMALYTVFDLNIVYILVCGLIAYLVLLMSYWIDKKYCGISVAMVTAIYTLSCELFLVESKEWHKVRGAQIMLSMKLIGLGFDITGDKHTMPRLDGYLGYVFCVGTVIFGPWTSYHDYTSAVHNNSTKGFTLQWILKIVRSSILCLVCVVISTCLSHWLIQDYSSKWLVAYRDAQSFRFSHYFVSYASEALAVLAGLGFTDDVTWGLTVSRPSSIELPRSLVEVVTNWNLPMHFWLKNYVFLVAQPYGAFIAIFLTYAASSLLHGLNFQLAAVLFSLGFYTYVESVFRSKLSRIFKACIKARRCKDDCDHEFKNTHPCVVLVNLVFGALSMFHLAYLGLMFDTSSLSEEGYSMDHTLGKWSSLHYASHWVIVGMYIFHLLI